MKKCVFGLLFLSSSLLAAPYGNMAPVPAPNSTMSESKMDDAAEETKDRFTSTEDHKLGSQIRVQVAEIIGAPKADALILVIDEGDVKLMGKVDSEETKRKIVQALHQLKGVKSIHNKLEVEKNGKKVK